MSTRRRRVVPRRCPSTTYHVHHVRLRPLRQLRGTNKCISPSPRPWVRPLYLPFDTCKLTPILPRRGIYRTEPAHSILDRLPIVPALSLHQAHASGAPDAGPMRPSAHLLLDTARSTSDQRAALATIGDLDNLLHDPDLPQYQFNVGDFPRIGPPIPAPEGGCPACFLVHCHGYTSHLSPTRLAVVRQRHSLHQCPLLKAPNRTALKQAAVRAPGRSVGP